MQPNVNLENVEALGAEEVLSVVLSAGPGPRACVTCSFQAEDMIVRSRAGAQDYTQD